jgi:uncharacterized protein YjbI with pentapeptide repeats
VQLRPPLAPRVPEAPAPLDPAALEDEGRYEAVELAGAGALSIRHLTVAEGRVRGTLAGARLPDLHLSDVAVAAADLANLRAPKAALRRVAVDQARLTGATLTDASLRDIAFTGCRMDLASLAAARLERVVFADCDLRETSFGEAILRDVRFERCDLGGAEFGRVRLQRVELAGCRLEGIRSVGDLRGASMPWPDIVANAGLFAAAAGSAPPRVEWAGRRAGIP